MYTADSLSASEYEIFNVSSLLVAHKKKVLITLLMAKLRGIINKFKTENLILNQKTLQINM